MTNARRVAVVLAGGAGTRMGGGKPSRAWGETSLLERALELARGFADEVAVAVRDAGQVGGQAGGQVGAPLLFDSPDVPGPLAGLASALAFARDRGAGRVQVFACDMPLLPADLTRRLTAALDASGAKVALPASNDRLHPVCGLWRVEAEPLLAGYLAQGRSSLRGLAEMIGEAVVDWGALRPDPFVNLNTLAELRAHQPPRHSGLTRIKAAAAGADHNGHQTVFGRDGRHGAVAALRRPDWKPPMFDPAVPITTFQREGRTIAVQIRRDLQVEPERLWTALTRPEDLVQWLAPGTIELTPGGAARLDFGDSGVVMDSQVTAVAPGRLLEYGWNGQNEVVRPLRWEIEPVAEGARLTLTLTLPADEEVGRAAAGWAAHLEMLAAALAGVPIRFPFALYQSARESYRVPVAVAEAVWELRSNAEAPVLARRASI